MNGFLGQVRLRSAAAAPLGQSRAPVEIWRTGATTPEEVERIEAGYRRQTWTENDEYRYRNAANQKYRECAELKTKLDGAKSAYESAEAHDEALYQAYALAVDRYNNCLSEYNYLWDVAEYGPPPSVPAVWQAPTFPEQEPGLVEPEEPTEPAEPRPVASVDWPAEVPVPTIEPGPSQETEPLPVPCDPLQGQYLDPATGQCVTPGAVPSEDWRTAGCAPRTQRLVRGGACVSPGLVSAAFGAPGAAAPVAQQAAAGMTAANAFMGRARPLRAAPLWRGRP